jgi:hypothetical protein
LHSVPLARADPSRTPDPDSAGSRPKNLHGSVRARRRPCSVESAAGKEPSNRAVGVPLHGPPVLVDEPMMERADQQEVVQVRAAPMPPPHDVVGLGESSRPAPGEPALSVAVADLAQHPRRRFAGSPTEPKDVPGPVLEHALDPSVAEQAPDRLRVDDRATIDLAAADAALDPVELRVDDHRGAILVGVASDPSRTKGHERIGPPGRREGAIPFIGHHRDSIGRTLERSNHDRTLRGWELSLEPEPSPLVEAPPRNETGPLRVEVILDRCPPLEVSPVSDGGAGHPLRPRDEVCFGPGRCEAGELHDLVQAELATDEGIRQPRKFIERVRRADPPVSLPARDAITHRDPVGRIPRARVPPGLAAIHLGNERQQFALAATDGRVDGVNRRYQMLIGMEVVPTHACTKPIRGRNEPPLYRTYVRLSRPLGHLFAAKRHGRRGRPGPRAEDERAGGRNFYSR